MDFCKGHLLHGRHHNNRDAFNGHLSMGSQNSSSNPR